MAAEAEQRLRDPVYGCTGLISRLQEEIRDTQCRLATTRATLAIAAANHAAIDVTERHKQDDDGQQQAAAAAELVDPADEFLDLDGLS
ncbi:LOB domain-containing protein 6 [Brachypodium distachyon]|nr:LOB domain-containing protein 6 [Brachypodium distachyon]|eukprot:XP_024317769.1 LOB domain-containing protein 6 [Brachypodium distachyon]